MAEPTPLAIEVKALVKRYGELNALDGVGLEVHGGEVLGLVGANGAGKTTLSRVLTGLIRPTSGIVRIMGTSVLDHPEKTKRAIGFVPESGAIFDKLTPLELLRAAGELYGMEEAPIEQGAAALLRELELEGRGFEPMASFSKGMKQKVCWAVALLHQPEVLVLDEPLNGLDAMTIAKVRGILRSHVERGGAALYASHLLAMVETICDRVAVLDRGAIIAIGTPRSLIELTQETSLETAVLSLMRSGAVR